MKRFAGTFCALYLITVGLSTVNAALLGVTNNSGLQGMIIPAPSQVLNSSLGSNTNQFGFDEQQNVTLLVDLAVDNNSRIGNNGTIAAGMTVNSHMIFLNKDGNPSGLLSANNSWQFDGNILGVMSDSLGTLEAASSGLLGAAGTAYSATGYEARGMDGNTEIGGGDFYALTGLNTLEVRMRVSQPGDWLRVVTSAPAVPIPSAVLLLGTGLIGLIAIKKRQKPQA